MAAATEKWRETTPSLPPSHHRRLINYIHKSPPTRRPHDDGDTHTTTTKTDQPEADRRGSI